MCATAQGSGEHGKLGHGDYFDKLVPVPLRGEQFGGSKVVFVSAAGVRSLAVTEDGKIYTWGKSNLQETATSFMGRRSLRRPSAHRQQRSKRSVGPKS